MSQASSAIDPAERARLEKELERFNTSELISMAVFNEFPGFYKTGASKGVPRDVLVDMLITFRPPETVEAMGHTRSRIETFTKRWWRKLSAQVREPQCPECRKGVMEKDKLIRCSDVGAAICFLVNKEHLG